MVVLNVQAYTTTSSETDIASLKHITVDHILINHSIVTCLDILDESRIPTYLYHSGSDKT